ncbi:VIT1/CCC1 transporter family protein [Thermobifida halotolerans]|uniref:VIT1/CCC1 transporter family protein n=1 Tax=Thermobifida halotolerans TaxID=483545 RepID=A0AA97LYL6_9ACTN|nr:VIT1/CCC1 transporter family protein [Thermobifida halotolerans]UOE20406.1 VIT1/CCC1 transporter family protein [Thermobifida halotolerans]
MADHNPESSDDPIPAAPTPATLRRWRRMLADEREESRAYRELAARRHGEEREILLRLAEAEERHAAHWERLLGDRIGRPRRGSPRMRTLVFLARHFGWVFVLALMQQAESRTPYGDPDVPPSIAADERIHAEVVRGLAVRGRSRLSGTLRAAVFGVNDGLVSNIALVLGVVGGGAATGTVLLTGLSGLLAGALSMAAGEYVSVSSQRELLAASTPDETARESIPSLDVDANELALVYRARGMSEEEAQHRADTVLRRSVAAPLPELPGVGDPEVVGTGLGAAASSFVFFAVGAALPVLPFLAGMEGGAAVAVAGTATGLALMLVGAVVGVLSGASPLRRALRQLAIGAGAAVTTYLLGLLFGATVT